MFLATRQKSRDQIVSCSLVSDEKFVLAIVASSKKLKVKLTSRFSGPTIYPYTLYRWETFSCLGHDPSQIYAMTGENVVLAERPAPNIVLADELLYVIPTMYQSHHAFFAKFPLVMRQTRRQITYVNLSFCYL